MRLDFFVKLKCQSNTIILSVGIKYSTRDPICDVIDYCTMDKISVHDKIVIENLKMSDVNKCFT